VDVPNQDLALIAGTHVHVKLQVAPIALIQVPASALLLQPAGPQVALVDSNGAVRLQDVSVDSVNGNFVEIASGLSEGDKAAANIRNHINQIVEGDKVTARQVTTLPARQPLSIEFARAVWQGTQRRLLLSATADSGG
jgi:hypothetical protein